MGKAIPFVYLLVNDARNLTFDFSAEPEILLNGESIASVNSVIVSPNTGLTLGSAAINGKTVSQHVTCVTANTYTLDMVIITSGSNHIDARAYIVVS